MDKKFTETFQKLVHHPYSFFVILLFVCLLAYGLNIPWMGFYWDDWPWIWFSHVLGPEGMLQIDVEHRPVSGVVLWVGALLAGENPIAWQIYNFILRLMGALSLGWALKKIWPKQREQITCATLLFLVYPGFGQQFVAVNNSRHLFPLITFFLSIGLMVVAARSRKSYWGYTALAVTLSLVTMFTTEYYYGLELIRPVIIWLLIRRDEKRFSQTILPAFKKWLPYLIPLLGVFIWRYTISKDVNYQITLFNEIGPSTDISVLQLLWSGIQDILASGIGTWFTAFQLPDPALFGLRSRMYYLGIVLVSTTSVLLYAIFLRVSQNQKKSPNMPPQPPKTWGRGKIPPKVGGLGGPWHDSDIRKEEISQDKRWGQEALLLGAAALVLSPIPFWVTGLDPKLTFPDDRLNLPMILGACLLLTAIIELAFKRHSTKVLLLSLMIGFSVGSHNQNAINYRRDWKYQIAFFQQLTTRIPDLKADTAILVNELPNNRSTDNSLAAPLNWTYAPDYSSGNMPLNMYYIELRFGREDTSLDNNPLTGVYRFFPYQSSPDQILVIYHRPPACLRVMDSFHHQYYPMLPAYMKDMMPYSHLGRIVADAESSAVLPEVLARYPSPKNWCYYFEKADLARQQENWAEIAQLGDIAFDLEDSPNHASERIPFIEGYAHVGRWDRAEELTFEALKINKFMEPMLCEAWERIEATTSPSTERDTILENINTQFSCSLY